MYNSDIMFALSNNKLELLTVLLMKITISYGVPAVSDSPGLMRIYTGDDVTMTWTFNETFQGRGTDFFYGSLWLIGVNGQGDIIYTQPDYGGRIGFSSAMSSVTLQLKNVGTQDATYSYLMEQRIFGIQPISNNDAQLFIYGRPQTPAISVSSLDPEMETLVTMTCSASSTSQPPDLRPDMKYTWSRTSGSIPGDRHSVSGTNGETLTINKVQRQDHQVTYTCTAQEEGSRETSSRNHLLNVRFSPGQPVVTGVPQTPPVEGNSLTGVTCTVPSGSEGNPAVYTYHWSNTESSYSSTSTDGRLPVNSATVQLHDGLWRCEVSNGVGTGPFREFTVIIYASPQVETDLMQTMGLLYSDTLEETCGFRGRPGASISWTYEGGSTLPAAVHVVNNSIPGGKFNITQSRLQWRSGATDASKRAASGRYQCHASNAAGSRNSRQMFLAIWYEPVSISLNKEGPLTTVENDPVSVVCDADCSPDCTYTWTRAGDVSFSRPQAELSFSQIKRNFHDTYTCSANNDHGDEMTQIVILVQYTPEIEFTIQNEVSLVQGDSTTLTCTIDSQPMSDIILRNMTDNSVLPADVNGNVAVYSIPSVDCLHTGEYKCTASNGVPSSDHSVDTTKSMDVKCPPRVTYPNPPTFYKGTAIGENYTFEVHVISNPAPIVTRDSWTFTQTNLTRADPLPPNVGVGQGQTTNRLALVCQLIITEVSTTNYGNYTVDASNDHGASAPVKLVLTPLGPPSAASLPSLVHRTAVSLTISWTAGFNGGYQQTFTVLYTAQGSGVEQSAEVETDADVNRGDVIVHKLMDPDTILPATLYTIRIKSENQYQGGSVVYGESDNFQTKAKPHPVSDPQYTFNTTHLEVSLIIQPVESVTHLITRVCTMTENCNQDNSTVTTPDVTVTMELPATANTYKITIMMYDGEDMVNGIEASQKITGSNVAAIAGGVVGGLLLAAAVIVVIIVLWRKGIILRKGKAESKEERNEPVQQYENMNVLVMAADQGSTVPGGESSLYEGIAEAQLREENIRTYQGMNQLSSSADKSIYEGLASSTVNVISSTCTKVVGVFSENAVYRVSSAKPLKPFQKSLPKNLTVKKIQDTAKYPSHHAYLEGAAETMVKLVNCDNTINCLGLACGETELLMEHAPFGTLRQYLTGVTEGTYANSIKNQIHDQMNFIHQACNGASAVAELKPQCLFHSLSADNALLVANKTIKLTGFAAASHVKARETEESEKKLPRPVRWLAPEAIDLRHCTQSDVWGFGVLMWEILSLVKTPFEGIEDNNIRTHIGKGHSPTKPDTCSEEMYDQMRLCWQMKAENRPTLADIKSDLQATTIYQNI